MSSNKNRKSFNRDGNRSRSNSKGNSRGGSSSRRKENEIEGVLDCRGSRFGFLINPDGDIFIPSSQLNGARHGDKVKIMAHSRGSEMLREGRVTEVLERNESNIVATVVFTDNKFFAKPDDRHFGDLLPLVNLSGASNNDKVIIEIKPDKFDADSAEVVTVIGRKGEIGVDVLSVIAAHNLKTEFNSDTLEQAERLPERITKEDYADREDFTNDLIFTIDGEDSKDFDDAVTLTKDESGYTLGVHIADVSQYVKENTPLDREALERATSVYLADRVIPMLPEVLSNGLCSLNEGQERLTLGVIIKLDLNGNYISHRTVKGVICSKARMTYKGVQAIIEGDESLNKRYAHMVQMLKDMYDLAEKRIALRNERGSIDFDFTESEIVFDPDGRVVDLKPKQRYMSYKVIEEFMVLANECIAREFNEKQLPFIYRVHDEPPAEKIETLNEFLKAVGINKSLNSPSSKDVALLLRSIPEEKKNAVSRVTLRSMSKAIYSVKGDGHFGLALKDYCHFTSPIRRYPDLMIHRVIKAYLDGGKSAAMKYQNEVAPAAARSSAAEKVASDCERKVDDYKKAEYMAKHIGDIYDGTVSSVTEFGLFVELDNSAEGLIHVTTFPRPMTYESRSMSLIGCGRKFTIGDSIRIKVDSVMDDRVNFSLAEPVDETTLAPITDSERAIMDKRVRLKRK